MSSKRKNPQKQNILQEKIPLLILSELVKFMIISQEKDLILFVGCFFYGISTYVGYLMPNPTLCK